MITCKGIHLVKTVLTQCCTGSLLIDNTLKKISLCLLLLNNVKSQENAIRVPNSSACKSINCKHDGKLLPFLFSMIERAFRLTNISTLMYCKEQSSHYTRHQRNSCECTNISHQEFLCELFMPMYY